TRRARAAGRARWCSASAPPGDSELVAAAAAAGAAEAAGGGLARLEHVLLRERIGGGVELHARLRQELALIRLDGAAPDGAGGQHGEQNEFHGSAKDDGDSQTRHRRALACGKGERAYGTAASENTCMRPRLTWPGSVTLLSVRVASSGTSV